MLSLLLRRLLRRNRTQSFQHKRTTPSHRIRLSLEPLEARNLLSGFALPMYELSQPHNGASPMSTAGPTGYAPAQIRHAYGFDQISFSQNGVYVPANGAGETIAIVDPYNDPNIAHDLQAFDQRFGLPDPYLTILNQNGGTALPGVDPSGSWELEESLDVEWAHALAPAANIVFIEANSNNFSDLFTAVRTAAALPGVAAVSMSWGGGEWSSESSSDSTFTTPAGHSGVVFIASSGDKGAPAGYPAVSPNVLAVGGTTLSLDYYGNYLSESAWSGSGGGISAYEPRPSYQPGTYSNGAYTGYSTTRMNPDVAYDADPNTGFPVYDSYNYGATNPWIQLGGTSDAAPQWADLIAITDQGRQLAGLSALDGPSQLLPMLYRLPGDFHDITSGTASGSPHYTAGSGYDLTTGLGTPIVNYLVPDLVYGAAPAMPTGLTATAVSSSQINLAWNSPPDAHSYTLERSLDGNNWQVLTTTSSTTYFDTGLLPNTAYYYRVLAMNGFGSSYFSAPIRATTQGGSSPSGSATFLKADTTTQGNWWGVYGGQGYNIIDNAARYPSYAQVSASGNSTWLWNSWSSDPRALQGVNYPGRMAACWYSPSSFTVNVNITDGQTHQLALYLLDWDYGGSRTDQVQITDARTGNVLYTEYASNFQNGMYLVWNISGDVDIRFTNWGNPNAVLSGMFFDPAGASLLSRPGSASFVKADTTTQGNWWGVYGSQGYNIIDNAARYPSYAQVSASGNSTWLWNSWSSDPRALQGVNYPGRMAACWYSPSSFTVNVNITDGQTHQLALYLLDWDYGGSRTDQVQITDARTGNVLYTEYASNFQNGMYLVWNISGDIDIRFTNWGNPNAVLSGMFFDPVTS